MFKSRTRIHESKLKDGSNTLVFIRRDNDPTGPGIEIDRRHNKITFSCYVPNNRNNSILGSYLFDVYDFRDQDDKQTWGYNDNYIITGWKRAKPSFSRKSSEHDALYILFVKPSEKAIEYLQENPGKTMYDLNENLLGIRGDLDVIEIRQYYGNTHHGEYIFVERYFKEGYDSKDKRRFTYVSVQVNRNRRIDDFFVKKDGLKSLGNHPNGQEESRQISEIEHEGPKVIDKEQDSGSIDDDSNELSRDMEFLRRMDGRVDESDIRAPENTEQSSIDLSRESEPENEYEKYKAREKRDQEFLRRLNERPPSPFIFTNRMDEEERYFDSGIDESLASRRGNPSNEEQQDMDTSDDEYETNSGKNDVSSEKEEREAKRMIEVDPGEEVIDVDDESLVSDENSEYEENGNDDQDIVELEGPNQDIVELEDPDLREVNGMRMESLLTKVVPDLNNKNTVKMLRFYYLLGLIRKFRGIKFEFKNANRSANLRGKVTEKFPLYIPIKIISLGSKKGDPELDSDQNVVVDTRKKHDKMSKDQYQKSDKEFINLNKEAAEAIRNEYIKYITELSKKRGQKAVFNLSSYLRRVNIILLHYAYKMGIKHEAGEEDKREKNGADLDEDKLLTEGMCEYIRISNEYKDF